MINFYSMIHSSGLYSVEFLYSESCKSFLFGSVRNIIERRARAI